MSQEKKFERTTQEQLKCFCAFVKSHPELQEQKNTQNPRCIEKLWQEVSSQLNVLRGPVRTALKWKETLGNRKKQLQSRNKKAKAERLRRQEDLSEFERQALETFGIVAIDGVQKQPMGFSAMSNLVERKNGNLQIKTQKANVAQIEFDGTSNSVESIPATYNDTNQTVHDGSITIKIEDEMDIKMEDEMEFCALSSTDQSGAEHDDEEHNNQTIHGNVERSMPVQSIVSSDTETPKYPTIQDEFADIENEIDFCEIVALNTPETTIADKPDVSETGKHQCDICFKIYSRECALITHRLRHGNSNFRSEEKIYQCNICFKKFSKRSKMVAHRRRHDKLNRQCPICGLVTLTQFELNQHMNTHDPKPIHFTCDICLKKYSTMANMKMHRKMHDEKNFYCQFMSYVTQIPQ